MDVWRSGRALSFRKLWSYITHLPRESSLGKALNSGHAPWSTEAYLLSDLWALQARRWGGEEAPERHPWREEIEGLHAVDEKSARTEKLKAAQARRRARRTPK